MWIATLITVLGVLYVAVITQFKGYRLGGVITVPVMVVYSLREFLMIPVFLVSILVAYVGLWMLKRRTLMYGRNLLVATIVMGSIVPTAVFLLLVGVGANLGVIQFIGSILPGLAAYNYQEIAPEYRKKDLLAAGFLFVVLFVAGWLLVTPWVAERFGRLTPPLLFFPTSDVAVYKGVVGYGGTLGIEEADPIILSRTYTVGIFAGGLAATEVVRRRFGVRIGVVAPVLVAIYAVASYWLPIMYLMMLFAMFLFVQAVHTYTLRYGRVLLGVSIALGMLVGILLTFPFPIERGPSAFFVAVLATVSAYNAHVSAPIERRLVLPLQIAIFAPTVVVVRLLTEPLPRGVPKEVTLPVVAGAVTVAVVCLAVAEAYTVEQPDDEEVLSESVLSGEDTG
ncbi:MAG: poly-gamma-glutamate biosynthesis protein PgsC/CapC [Halobacteriales archaeon]|nr:poly-gamma-glutamate biosynthesis protein PgsC/CapC [Halobacteriales archaeon]